MKHRTCVLAVLLICLSLTLGPTGPILAADPLPQTAAPTDLAERAQPVRAFAALPAAAETSLPAGVSADWWTDVQQNLATSEYDVTWQDALVLSSPVEPDGALPDLGRAGAEGGGMYSAPNRAQGLRTYFAADGIRLLPRQYAGARPPWTLALRLASVNGQAPQAIADAAGLAARGGRIEYARGGLTEWYVNDARGLEQGFTFALPPPGGAGITIELAVTGSLAPRLSADDAAVEFLGATGGLVLRYAGLAAIDADGRSLPARMDVDGSAVRLVVDDAGATYPVTVDPIIADPNHLGAWESAWDCGASNCTVNPAGDVNDDGYADFLFGTFTSDGTNAGPVSLYQGGPGGPNPEASWTTPAGSGDYASAARGAGDVNGDGYDDVIVGEYSYYDSVAGHVGRALVYYGSAGGLGATPGWSVMGTSSSGQFGRSVDGAGDVNGDGYGDVIVGAPLYPGGTGGGALFVFYGSASGLAAAPAWSVVSAANQNLGMIVRGLGDVNGDGYADVGATTFWPSTTSPAYAYYGSASGPAATPSWTLDGLAQGRIAAAGDVNGDGCDDVLIGDPGAGGEQASLYLGSADGLAATAAWTWQASSGATLGYSISGAADVDADGYADVVVSESPTGALLFRGSGGGLGPEPARTYGPFDSPSVALAGDANGDGYADVLVGSGRAYLHFGFATWEPESNQAGALFGGQVAGAGDVNGDGYGDVLVGAINYDHGQADEGAAFLYLGSAAGPSKTAAWTAESDQASAWFGSVAGAGDVNGDGYDDVLVGADTYNNGQTDEGRAYLYLGSVSGLSGTAAWMAESDQTRARFGRSLAAAGDVNGDGYADVVVCAHYYDNGQTNEGRAYLYNGSASGLSASASWTAESDQENAEYCVSVAGAGNVNGDGYSDVIVGAWRYQNGQTLEGAAFVYLGGSGGLATTASWTGEGNQDEARFGLSVAGAGDVNGDGYTDVLVGAPYYDNGQTAEGAAFLFQGSSSGPGATAAWTTESDQEKAQYGYAVAGAGDLNGDGYADVLVSARMYDNGQADEGRAYAYLGGSGGLSAAPAWTREGDQEGAQLGTSVAGPGDVNGDSYAEAVTGAPYYDGGQADEGRAFLTYGSAPMHIAPDWKAPTFSSSGVWTEGCAIDGAGDVNGDGYADVIIGEQDSHDPDGLGHAYLYLGSASGLPTTPAWSVAGAEHLKLAREVAGAGDVNGDGYDDLLVATLFYANGEANEGAVWLYYGGPSGPGATAAWMVEGNQAWAFLGEPAAGAGDLNGDGYADIVAGATMYDGSVTDGGRVYVWYGGPSGPGASPDWIVDGDQSGDNLNGFGAALGAAGDVNGDGYGDLIIGQSGYDAGLLDSGRVWVYYGGPGGLRAPATPASADWIVDGDQANTDGYASLFGNSVGTAGDVNGDGFDDVIIGAPMYDTPTTQYAGRAYLYYGSVAGPRATPSWVVEGAISARVGRAVSAAGDVNGDGYGDVLVGAFFGNGALLYHGGPLGLDKYASWGRTGGPGDGSLTARAGDVNGDGYDDVLTGSYDGGTDGEPRVYYGAGGGGIGLRPRQRRADDSAPVAEVGQAISPNQVRLAALGRTPFGSSGVRLEWEIKPVGTPFDGSGLGRTGYGDSGTVGRSFNQLVGSLAFETRYHWRVRILGRTRGTETNRAPTYRSRWLYGSTFFTALSGAQAIAGTGQTNLLGQAAYVNVTNAGSPALTSLTLRGYPNTLPPNYASLPGWGAGAQVLNRYFSVTPNADAAGYALTLCLNYDDSEVTAAGASEANLQLCRWTGGAWTCPARAASSDTAANLVCADGVSALSNWAIVSNAACANRTLTAALASGKVQLTWSGGATDVYRGTTPYFTPGSAYAPNMSSPWSDNTGGVGNPGVNYTYLLKAAGCVGPTSQRVGEFDFTLTPGQ